MPDDRKVFDIAKPTATATARPVIASGPLTPDPMVNAPPAVRRSIPLTFEPDEEATAPSVAPAAAPAEKPELEQPSVAPAQSEEPEPEISDIPVSQAPDEISAEPAATTAASTITPALPGAPEISFASVPKFGELQAKIDAHPLFSGHKEKRVKVRHLPHFFWPLTALLILVIVAYLAIDAGLVRGASHLPYHVFKQSAPAPAVPAITAPVPAVTTKPVVQPAAPKTVSQFQVWQDYASPNFGYSFSYPKDYGAFTARQTADTTVADIMASGVPEIGLAHVSGDLSITDYKSLSAAIPTYRNGPTIELKDGSWIVTTINAKDLNRYKVGQVFKDISTVKNAQGQNIYTIVQSGGGATSYIIIFVSDKSLHTISLPQFSVQKSDSSGVNDQTSYDAMFRQLRSSVKVTP